MRKNLLKNMILALLLTAAVPTLTAQVHVGDILCEGNAIISPANYPSSGATAIGVVFYVDNTGQHGWAIALEDAGTSAWGTTSDTPLPNYTNKRQAIYDLDGYNNTNIMRQHSGINSSCFIVDFENGWYVPAIGQWNYLYGNVVEVNASLSVAGGTRLFEGTYDWRYWSSTEVSNYSAWAMVYHGDMDDNPHNQGKNGIRPVRAVRNF